MAHKIDMSKGKPAILYNGDIPWHGLGTKVDRLQTSEECMEKAGLDYEVQKLPVFIRNEKKYRGALVPVPEKFATTRMDTMQPLGIVGSDYVPLQNKDAFKFFDALVGQGEAIYETAGALDEGKKIWLLAKLPDFIKIGSSKDTIKKYLLLYNSHDGSSKVKAKLTPVRVVCNNTLTAALSGTEQTVGIFHRANLEFNLSEAHKFLGLVNQVYSQLGEIFSTFSTQRMTQKSLIHFVNEVVPLSEKERKNGNKYRENERERILELVETGKGMDLKSAKGTLWGAYNAVTEYADHIKNAKYAGETRMVRSLFWGDGLVLKQRAFQIAADLSGINLKKFHNN